MVCGAPVFSYTQITTAGQALLSPMRRAFGSMMRFGLDGVAAQAPAVYSAYAKINGRADLCLLYTSPSPRDRTRSRMPSSA